MKTLRTLSAAAALAIASTAGMNAHAVAPVAASIEQAPVYTPSQLTEALHQIRIANAAGQEAIGLLARIDTLVEQIDALAQTNPESTEELADLRKKALFVRAELTGMSPEEAAASVGATDLVGCLGCGLVAAEMHSALGGGETGGFFAGGGGGGGFAGGGGGGGGMLGGGGGVGGFAAIGLGAAGLAVGVSDSNNNSAPGVPASPSTP